MKIIGLTGGIATGKSTVAKILESKGIPVVDADALAHQAMEKNTDGFKEVVSKFGTDFVDGSGEIDRAKLGELIFADSQKRKMLENIIHPRVATEMQRQMGILKEKGHKFAVYMVPLLFEKQLEGNFEVVLFVDTPREIQIERFKKRSGFTRKECLQRINTQMSREEKLSKTPIIIDNSKDILNTEKNVESVVKDIF